MTAQPTEPVCSVYEPTFALVAQGAKRAALGDRTLEYRAGQYLVVTVDLPIVAHVTRASREKPYTVFALSLNPAVIASLLLETNAKYHDAESAGLGISNAPTELLDPIARLLRLLDRPDEMAVFRPMLEREILWRLLAGEQGAMVRQIGLADSCLSQISRTIRSIRTRYAEPLRINELAQVAGMSVSAFHRHFRAVTTMSPLQYQKQIRLQQARAQLVANAQDVATVGFDVGYESPSQFSREYTRLFGVPPGKDMKRLRTTPKVERNTA